MPEVIAYTIDQVVEKYLAHLGMKDPHRWLATRLKDGRIPGKPLCRKRGMWVMTDRHIDRWLNGDESPEAPEVSPEDVQLGVTPRASRRLKTA